ncbi:MAG TPA: stage II sporulation protein M [Aliidongia sp.]|nr:stage II sporulation protein M [Aliidongia sp.]
MTNLTLKSSEFRKGREAGWRALENLIGRLERRGVRDLSVEELQSLPLLYRSAVSSLSVARSIALDRNLLRYLEDLALRGFLAVYGPRIRLGRGLLGFFTQLFPRAVRQGGWHILIATLALLTGFVAGFLLVGLDESWFTTLVPSGMAGGRGPGSTRAELMQGELFAPWPGAAAAFGIFASFLFSHNTLVGILCFSLGLAAGVPTLLLLVYQGLILGAFLALHMHRGLGVAFLGWISIHGVTELTAIMLCGAAGLMIGGAILFPGRHGRVDNAAIRGRFAAQIAVGAIFMFLVAGILEGGFRQLIASTPWRFAVGGTTGALWLAYFLGAGRRARL